MGSVLVLEPPTRSGEPRSGSFGSSPRHAQEQPGIVDTIDALAPPVIDCSTWDATGFDRAQLYLTEEEDMGQGGPQSAIIEVFLPSLQMLARARIDRDGWRSVFVASDNFFAWDRSEARLQVSPDVYLLDHPPAGTRPKRYETWRHNPPRFALEVVSSDWKKDYKRNPERYAALGTRELVLADPRAFSGSTRVKERRPFVCYRRDDAGRLVRTYAGPGPLYSEQLDAYLRFVTSESGQPFVRISYDEAGEDVVPTGFELADALELQVDAERRRADAERERADDMASLRRRLAAVSGDPAGDS